MRGLIIAFLLVATAGLATAQRSGGRMGGGSWGSSPSSGGSYSGGGSSPSWSSGGGWSSHDSRNELFTVSQIGDGEDLRKALEAASYLTAEQLVAVDVVWMPSEENDRMSSMELEARYPRPELIPIRGALVGKTFCAYCAGPFPAELVSCPHCGAPAPGREKAA